MDNQKTENQKAIDGALLVLAEALQEEATEYARSGDSPSWELLQELAWKVNSSVIDAYAERVEKELDEQQRHQEYLNRLYEVR